MLSTKSKVLAEEFAEAGDPLLMALFEGDGDGARRLSGTLELSVFKEDSQNDHKKSI